MTWTEILGFVTGPASVLLALRGSALELAGRNRQQCLLLIRLWKASSKLAQFRYARSSPHPVLTQYLPSPTSVIPHICNPL